ncbi:MAG TPA: hypothetical protein VLK28_12965 [Methylomirabilota bacterium]|nr:hypothetical protein [Methylomirabilota bacterium]
MSRTTGIDFGLAGFRLTFKLELLQHAGSLIAQAHVARTVLVSDPAMRRVQEAL